MQVDGLTNDEVKSFASKSSFSVVYGLDWARFVVVLDLKFFELGFLNFN